MQPIKAEPCNVVTSCGIVIDDKLVHSKNALAPIVSNVLGKPIVAKFLHQANADSSIVIKAFDNVANLKLVHKQKARFPMVVTGEIITL